MVRYRARPRRHRAPPVGTRCLSVPRSAPKNGGKTACERVSTPSEGFPPRPRASSRGPGRLPGGSLPPMWSPRGLSPRPSAVSGDRENPSIRPVAHRPLWTMAAHPPSPGPSPPAGGARRPSGPPSLEASGRPAISDICAGLIRTIREFPFFLNLYSKPCSGDVRQSAPLSGRSTGGRLRPPQWTQPGRSCPAHPPTRSRSAVPPPPATAPPGLRPTAPRPDSSRARTRSQVCRRTGPQRQAARRRPRRHPARGRV